jgi:tetratricopeptide (TPR) repeat protein
LLSQIGLYLRGRATFDEARDAFERALAILQATLPPEHPSFATSLNNLAGVLHAQGDLVGARQRHERALAIDQVAYGPDHPAVATDLNNLAGVLRDQGDLAGARQRHEQALAIRETVLPPEHPSIATGLGNLANVLRDQGDLDDAVEAWLRALRTRQVRQERYQEGVAFFNLGVIARERGRLDAALDLLIVCYLIDRDLKHPDVTSDLEAVMALAGVLGLSEDAQAERVTKVEGSYSQDWGGAC